MFIARKKSVLPTLDSKPAAPIPTLLHGYGGFGVSKTPGYSGENAVLFRNMGAMYVVANIRGGGEYGEQWHAAATRENKQRSYDDFIAAAEYLIERGYTTANHLAITGRSNGGTLVTACANQRPDLFAAVLGTVPVTDMLRYDKFTGGAEWCSDFGCVS